MKPNILIREAGPEDARRIVELIGQLGSDSEVNEPYVLYYLTGTGRGVLLAQQEECICGLLSYSARADLFHGGDSVMIEELIVDETARGKGVGSALMEALLQRAQAMNCKELCLAVMPGNEGAIHFYKRHGLVEEALFLERHF